MSTRRARPHRVAVVAIHLTAVIAIHLAAAGSASAETDLSGEWTPRYHEDLPERIPGPALGEYHGIPLNDAARRRAESWSASILSVLEHQCVPHPADYGTRGPSHMRIWKEVDRDTQQLVAIRMRISAWGTERAIWMDGRAHPPPYAAHTWQGFSTGVWNGNVLTVTTTHLKPGWIRRNGVPRNLGTPCRITCRGRIRTCANTLNSSGCRSKASPAAPGRCIRSSWKARSFGAPPRHRFPPRRR